MRKDQEIIVKRGPYTFERKRKIGEIEIMLPMPPKLEEIDKHDFIQKFQKFTPPEIPAGLNDRWVNDEDLTEEDEAFRERERKRFNEGYWFMNNGNIEYITGNHYFYISYWKIPLDEGEGLPMFKDSDRDYFYFWEEAKNNPLCAGIIFVTNRRDGNNGNCGPT